MLTIGDLTAVIINPYAKIDIISGADKLEVNAGILTKCLNKVIGIDFDGELKVVVDENNYNQLKNWLQRD